MLVFSIYAPRAAIGSMAKMTGVLVVPFHSGQIMHPKIVKQVLEAIEETRSE